MPESNCGVVLFLSECYTYIDYKGRFLSFLFSVALYATRQKLQQGQ